MKNLLVLCILLFTFQNAVLAQGDFGITLGGGVYNQDIISDTKSKFTPQLKAGFSYQRDIINNRFQLNSSLNFHYFNAAKIVFESVRTEASIIGGGTMDDTALSSYNSVLTSRELYFAVSLPLVLSVKLKKISIGAGTEFQIKTENPQIEFGYLGSLQYQISERFSLRANYVRSLMNNNRTYDYLKKARTQRIEASLRYRFLKV